MFIVYLFPLFSSLASLISLTAPRRLFKNFSDAIFNDFIFEDKRFPFTNFLSSSNFSNTSARSFSDIILSWKLATRVAFNPSTNLHKKIWNRGFVKILYLHFWLLNINCPIFRKHSKKFSKIWLEVSVRILWIRISMSIGILIQLLIPFWGPRRIEFILKKYSMKILIITDKKGCLTKLKLVIRGSIKGSKKDPSCRNWKAWSILLNNEGELDCSFSRRTLIFSFRFWFSTANKSLSSLKFLVSAKGSPYLAFPTLRVRIYVNKGLLEVTTKRLTVNTTINIY